MDPWTWQLQEELKSLNYVQELVGSVLLPILSIASDLPILSFSVASDLVSVASDLVDPVFLFTCFIEI